MVAHAARHDAGEVVEVGIDVETDPMEADPAAHPDADGGDLVLARWRPCTAHPDADAILPALADNAEGFERQDQPALETGDIGADIGAAVLEVEHDISDPL